MYKGELYSVRDNGAVFRHARKGKRKRKEDETWTFGKTNKKTGYMEIGSERVHRIVAFAFLGEPPTPQHVVDHIDTNRRNNRPQNLRWLTKLENALNNPITKKKIEFLCGSIEAFVNDPSLIQEFANDNPNFEWMRTVTLEEAKTSYERLMEWAKNNKKPSSHGNLGEWIYQKGRNGFHNKSIEYKPYNQNISIDIKNFQIEDLLTKSLTSNALQRNWRTPTKFPCCPKEDMNNSIKTYFSNLSIGTKFSCNQYGDSIVQDFTILTDSPTILVLCENINSLKPWSLTTVSYENNKYVHTSMGTYFSENGAKKQFTIAQGKEWTREDSIDDYC